MTARLGRLTFPISSPRSVSDDRAGLLLIKFAVHALSALREGLAAHREFLALTARGVPKREALDRAMPQPTKSP